MTILFLALWLQMSAHPQIQLHCVTEFGCEHSERWGDAPFFIQGVDSSSGVLSWTSAENPTDTPWENCVVSDAAGNDKPCGAADETDGKPRQNMPPLPPSGSMECWNDWQTSDYLCQDSKGRTVDVTKAMLRLMDEVDVPAVQEPQLPDLKWCGAHMKTDAGYSICVLHIAQIPPRTTCTDKSRILEHDENSPANYWCRKVQP